jgi:hypothetical protein
LGAAYREVLGADILGRMRNELWRGGRLGIDTRIQRAVHLPPLRANVGIGRQLADEAVVEAEGCEGAGCGREGDEIVHWRLVAWRVEGYPEDAGIPVKVTINGVHRDFTR